MAVRSNNEGTLTQPPTPGLPAAVGANEIQSGSGGELSEPEDQAPPGTTPDGLSGPEDSARTLPDEALAEVPGLAAVKQEPSALGSSVLAKYWELGKMDFDEEELTRYELQC